MKIGNAAKGVVLRAKTLELFSGPLSEKQSANAGINIEEAKKGALQLKSRPRRIILELTNACNFRCIMCGRNEADFKKRVLRDEWFDFFTPLLEDIEEVTLFGWGEPTLHPGFADYLKVLADCGVRKYFVTNGSTIGNIKETLFDRHVDIMAVSVDGASAEENDRIRTGGNFDVIIRELRGLIEERERRGLDYPYVNFVFTCMVSNIAQLPDMVRLAKDVGIEEVKAVYLTAFSEEMKKEILYNKQDIVSDSFDKAVELARDLDILIKLPHIQGEDPGGSVSHKPCYVGWRDVFLGADGYFRPCQSTALTFCHISEVRDFEDVWNSDKYMAFRKAVNDEASMPEECRSCYQSSHANWNMEYAFDQTSKVFSPNWS